MFQNIIFDLGGVVVNADPHSWLVDRFFNQKMEDMLYDLTFGSEGWRQWDCGEIGYNTLCNQVLAQAKEHHCEFEASVVMEDWFSMLTNKTHTIELMRQLKKAGCRLYYLSNTEPETIDMLERRSFWKLWDGGLTSYECGLMKPDKKIYLQLLVKYRLKPNETIFIDDKKENVDAAEALGLLGIRYRNHRALFNELQAHGLPLRSRGLLRHEKKPKTHGSL